MVIRVDKCNECPFCVEDHGYPPLYICLFPSEENEIEIKCKDLDKMHPKCPLRDECISIRIK